MGLAIGEFLISKIMETQPLTPEFLVPRIGEVLIEKGVITLEQNELGAQQQEKWRAEGRSVPFGEVLLQLGFINRKTLDEAVTEQIFQLHAALKDANEELRRANEQLEVRVAQRTDELQQALKKLAELNRLKANLVANISHELRTPLTHLKGYLDLISTGDLGPTTEEQERALQVMNRSTERLERLIEDLILFSTADRGEISLQKQWFNLTSLCRVALSRCESKAAAKRIELRTELSTQAIMVNADQEKIGWVILQLLDNAIKFTPEGGFALLHLDTEGEFAHIAVVDSGIGIPPERTDEIFEAFHQLDGSSTRRYGGTGLGLALVKRIIDAHNTTIHFSSQVGQGSKFEFLLQLA